MTIRIRQLGERLGLIVDPRAKVWQLTVGEQQRVEILKMLYRGTNVLIMDEPTAVLAPSEIEDLFITLKKMTAEGKSIVFISHKLNEVTEISNRITVLRRGKVTAGGINTSETTIEKLAELMVGRQVLFRIDKKPVNAGEVVLSVENIQAENDKNLPALRGLSLQVRAGEIVGLAGVAGNGQSELAEVITGMRKCTAGTVTIQEQDITNQSVLSSIQKGVSHIPEDRTHVGSAPNLSVTDNVIMKNYNQQPIGMGWLINSIAANRFATKLKNEYRNIRSFDQYSGKVALWRKSTAGDPCQRNFKQTEIDDCRSTHSWIGCWGDRGCSAPINAAA